METSSDSMENVHIQIEIIGNIEDEEPKLENDERYIPIEIIGRDIGNNSFLFNSNMCFY